jgi:chorismate synthase
MNYTIFGESHGPAIGVVLQDVPPGIPLEEAQIDWELSRRATGKNALSTARKEADQVEFLSGVFEGKTTGTPLAMMIRNGDQHSKDYEAIRYTPRPGHGDLTGYVRYEGCNDYRGGGHFSGRLTAPLVAAGALAKAILRRQGVFVYGHIASIGDIWDDPVDPVHPDTQALEAVAHKAFPTLSDTAGAAMSQLILQCREAQDSVGGRIQCLVTGLPMGLGAPDFDCNAETLLARQLFAVPAIKGLEFGSGFQLSAMRGSQANDPWSTQDGHPVTTTNHNGGILGGITTGMPVVFQVAVKPTPSIAQPQQTIDLRTGEPRDLEITGRHDPCIVHRAVPVVEAAAALGALALLESARRNNNE